MHILLYIPFTQNSQSALFHDAKIPNLALFASQKFPIWGVPDPFPMKQKKSLFILAGYYHQHAAVNFSLFTGFLYECRTTVMQ